MKFQDSNKTCKTKSKYGEGEIPFESKTGTGPILLTFSFPYVRDWINEYPFKNEPNASIICNQITGAPIHADTLNSIMRHLKERIERLIESSQITDEEEKERLTYLIKVKKWNPYCIRHLGDKSMFNLLVPNATMVSLADRYDFSVKWLHENALSYFTKLTGGEIKDTSENHDGDSRDSRDSGDN